LQKNSNARKSSENSHSNLAEKKREKLFAGDWRACGRTGKIRRCTPPLQITIAVSSSSSNALQSSAVFYIDLSCGNGNNINTIVLKSSHAGSSIFFFFLHTEPNNTDERLSMMQVSCGYDISIILVCRYQSKRANSSGLLLLHPTSELIPILEPDLVKKRTGLMLLIARFSLLS
jgi:hypothetical protein